MIVVEVLEDTEVKAVMISIIERKDGARNITKSTSLENIRIIGVEVVDLVHTHTLHIHPIVVLVPDRDQQNGAAQNHTRRRKNHINVINVVGIIEAEVGAVIREKSIVHLTLLMLTRLVRLCNN